MREVKDRITLPVGTDTGATFKYIETILRRLSRRSKSVGVVQLPPIILGSYIGTYDEYEVFKAISPVKGVLKSVHVYIENFPKDKCVLQVVLTSKTGGRNWNVDMAVKFENLSLEHPICEGDRLSVKVVPNVPATVDGKKFDPSNIYVGVNVVPDRYIQDAEKLLLDEIDSGETNIVNGDI